LLPDDTGFQLFPNSLRVDPGKSGTVLFKTYVNPELRLVPDGGVIKFSTDNSDVKVSPKSVTLRDVQADENDVFTVRLTVSCSKEAKALLSVSYAREEDECKINFARKKPREGSSGGGNGSGFNFQELRFENTMEHSRLVGNTIQINVANPFYLKAVSSGSHKAMLDYVVDLIFKETGVFNNLGSHKGLEILFTQLHMKDQMPAKKTKKKVKKKVKKKG